MLTFLRMSVDVFAVSCQRIARWTGLPRCQGAGQALHDNPLTSYCVVDKSYRSAVGRTNSDEEKAYVVSLTETFAAKGHRVPDLMHDSGG